LSYGRSCRSAPGYLGFVHLPGVTVP
jgi:hypothetical protein